MRQIGRLVAPWTVSSLLLLSAAVSVSADETSDVKIVNQSEWTVSHLFLSPVDEDEWGPDQLGEKVIAKGDSFTLTEVPCDLWDLKIIDEDGDECVLTEVDLCGEEATWNLTNEELLSCQADSEEEE
jgi:hypothetical protein